MKTEADVLIVGAGAAGLMASIEIAKAGKKVLILEARGRVGGRILPLDSDKFGYPAQGGAEFVHGDASLTKQIIKEAGLTYIPEEGEIWSVRNGSLVPHQNFFDSRPFLKEKLESLAEDVSIFDFLEQNFGGEENKEFRDSILETAESYDSANPKEISTFMLRDEWLINQIWESGKIKEGYGVFIEFLEKKAKSLGVEIFLNKKVSSVDWAVDEGAIVLTESGKAYSVLKVVITNTVRTLENIKFIPEISSKIEYANKIGFGQTIKTVIKFKTRWWESVCGVDLSKLSFMLSKEEFTTWWTQYPEMNPVLVGWMAGPRCLTHKEASREELFDLAITSLSNIFKIEKIKLLEQVIDWEVSNWSADPFSLGSYSYTTYYTKNAYEKLAEPLDNKLFFAGEALSVGGMTATVDGALVSGKEVAEKILKNYNG